MKRSFLIITILLSFKIIAVAQADIANKYGNTITGIELKKQLSIIASDEMDGRETGTEGQRKAAAYIEGQFKQMGLIALDTLKGYQQFYPLYQDSMTSTLTVNKIPAVYGTDYLCPAASNDNGNNKAAKIIFAGYGIEDNNYSDYTNIDVKGKVVVFFLGEPKQNDLYLISGTKSAGKWSYPGLNLKLALAASKGAAGAFVINPSQDVFSQKAIDNSKKTNFYFPRQSAGKPVNYALLSHAFAKNLLGKNFDTILALVKTGGLLNTLPVLDKKNESGI